MCVNKYTLLAREQVKDLLVVDFKERAFYEEFFVFTLHFEVSNVLQNAYIIRTRD